MSKTKNEQNKKEWRHFMKIMKKTGRILTAIVMMATLVIGLIPIQNIMAQETGVQPNFVKLEFEKNNSNADGNLTKDSSIKFKIMVNDLEQVSFLKCQVEVYDATGNYVVSTQNYQYSNPTSKNDNMEAEDNYIYGTFSLKNWDKNCFVTVSQLKIYTGSDESMINTDDLEPCDEEENWLTVVGNGDLYPNEEHTIYKNEVINCISAQLTDMDGNVISEGTIIQPNTQVKYTIGLDQKIPVDTLIATIEPHMSNGYELKQKFELNRTAEPTIYEGTFIFTEDMKPTGWKFSLDGEVKYTSKVETITRETTYMIYLRKVPAYPYILLSVNGNIEYPTVMLTVDAKWYEKNSETGEMELQSKRLTDTGSVFSKLPSSLEFPVIKDENGKELEWHVVSYENGEEVDGGKAADYVLGSADGVMITAVPEGMITCMISNTPWPGSNTSSEVSDTEKSSAATETIPDTANTAAQENDKAQAAWQISVGVDEVQNNDGTVSLNETTKASIIEAISEVLAAVDTENERQDEIYVPNVQVNMANATVVSADILNFAKGKNVDIEFIMEGFSWVINGKNIKSDNITDVDMKIIVGGENVPGTKITEQVGNMPTVQLTIPDHGDFGFEVGLKYNFGKEYANKYANLFYYKTDGTLSLETSALIDADGYALLKFTHASDYVVAFGDDMTGVKAVPETGDNTPIAVMGILLAAGLVAVMLTCRKKVK